MSFPKLIQDAFKTLTSSTKVDKICYTAGPGQYQSLSRGYVAARVLAASLNARLIPIHHMEGHIYSSQNIPFKKFPFLSVLLSGGHTVITLVNSVNDYSIMSRSVDDNIGEVYDKVARIFPVSLRGPNINGQVIEHLAGKCKCKSSEIYEIGGRTNVSYFSFSGIKSEVIKDLSVALSDEEYFSIACKFQRTLIASIIGKISESLKIVKSIGISPMFLAFGGGVTCNQSIRNAVYGFSSSNNIPTFFPDKELCTDNATMICKASIMTESDSRYMSGRLMNPIPDYPLGFAKDDDEALHGYISK
jgi:N6-L-threonylcarbamoyladenine synthase